MILLSLKFLYLFIYFLFWSLFSWAKKTQCTAQRMWCYQIWLSDAVSVNVNSHKPIFMHMWDLLTDDSGGTCLSGHRIFNKFGFWLFIQTFRISPIGQFLQAFGKSGPWTLTGPFQLVPFIFFSQCTAVFGVLLLLYNTLEVT